MMCLAPPPDVGDVGHPLQVPGDGVETDEEPREQQDRDRCDRTNKCRHLQGTHTPGWTHLSEVTQVSVWGHTGEVSGADLQRGGGGSDQQTQTLSHQRGQDPQRQEEEEAASVGRLSSHPVHNTAIHQGEYYLYGGQMVQDSTEWSTVHQQEYYLDIVWLYPEHLFWSVYIQWWGSFI